MQPTMMPPGARPLPQPERRMRIKPTFFGVLTFLVGATAFKTVQLIGEASLAELLLPVLAIAALFTVEGRRVLREKSFRLLVGAMFVTLVGYMLSDYVAGSAPDAYLRGWGRAILTLSNFVALAIVVSQDRRNLWWWAAGFGAAATLYFRIVLHMPLPMWKQGYAEYLTVGFAAFALFLPPRVGAAGFVTLGIMSVKWDFRIHALICFGIAWAIWMRSGIRVQRRKRSIWPLILALGAAFVTAQIAVQLTEDQYNRMRREESDAGRINGLKLGLGAFVSSPIVGYGSWGTSPDLDRLYSRIRGDEGGERLFSGVNTGLVHSQVLQSLAEGGILGGAFFLVLAWLLVKRLTPLILLRPLDPLSPILFYYAFYGLWHLFMSPYAAPHRLQIALGALVAVIVSTELARRPRATPMPQRPAPASRTPATSL